MSNPTFLSPSLSLALWSLSFDPLLYIIQVLPFPLLSILFLRGIYRFDSLSFSQCRNCFCFSLLCIFWCCILSFLDLLGLWLF
jgi:hypothetical protein